MNQEDNCGLCDGFKSAFSQFKSNSNNKEAANSSEKLGNSTWFLLHTTSAYYPEYPTEMQKQTMIGFINGLAEFYPCKKCSQHFKEHISNYPPNVNGGNELSLWFCKIHNIVNKMNDKPIFDCNNLSSYKK